MIYGYEDMIMSWFSEHFTKWRPGWRHDMLMNLKMFLSRLKMMTYDCVKFERNWTVQFWVIVHTKKWSQIYFNWIVFLYKFN